MRHGFLKKRLATVQRPNAASDSGSNHADLCTQTMKDAIEFIENNGQEPKRGRGDYVQDVLAQKIQHVMDSGKPRDAALQPLMERYQQLLSQIGRPSDNPPPPASRLASVCGHATR